MRAVAIVMALGALLLTQSARAGGFDAPFGAGVVQGWQDGERQRLEIEQRRLCLEALRRGQALPQCASGSSGYVYTPTPPRVPVTRCMWIGDVLQCRQQ